MAKIDVNVGDIKDRVALPEGVYGFRVEEFSDLKIDKSGNQYLKVKLRYEVNGEVYTVNDNYLAIESIRFRDFVRSTGHADIVSDTFDLVGLTGESTLIQKALDDGKIVNNVGRYLPKV